MNIKKSGNKITLSLKKGENLEEEWWYSDSFTGHDLLLSISSLDGWSYLIDTNQMKVFPIDGYHYDAIKELKEKGKVVLTALEEDDAQDYLKEALGEE